MTAALDLDGALLIDLRLHIIVAGGHSRQGCKHIDSRNGAGRLLNPHDLCRNSIAHLTEQVILQGKELVFCSKNHILQVFQVIGGVALCVG